MVVLFGKQSAFEYIVLVKELIREIEVGNIGIEQSRPCHNKIIYFFVKTLADVDIEIIV